MAQFNSRDKLVMVVAPCVESPAGGAAMLMWVWAKSSAADGATMCM